jgi:hypothetical protein
MPYTLIDITVTEKTPHKRLPNRVTGRVRAVLNEERDGAESTHELSIPVWAERAQTMSEEDIDMALMLKAASIIARLKANLEKSDGLEREKAAETDSS